MPLSFFAILMQISPQPLPRISFPDAIAAALQRNVQASVAATEVRRSEALLEQARAGSLPTLVGNVDYTRLDHARVLGNTVLAGRDQLAANLVLTVPLVAPNGWTKWSHARTAVEVASASEREVHRAVALQVARAYLAVITQIRLVEVSQHAVDTAAAHYNFAHTRYMGGVGNRLDELRADQELANSQGQLENLLTALARAREGLGVLVGAETACDVDATMQLPSVPAPEDTDETAIRSRQDIIAARARLQAATEIKEDSWADFLPNLLLVGQPFFQQPPTATVPRWGWQAQALLSLPFYDGGARYGALRERIAAQGEAQEILANALRQARSEVRLAFTALRHAEDALVIARRASTRAQDSIVLANEDYQAGNTNNLQVIDAERVGRDAETGTIMAEDTVRQARLDLLIAAGRFP